MASLQFFVASLIDGKILVFFKISLAPTEVANAFLFGHFSLGFIISSLLKPKFFKALAQKPIFSGN